MQLWLREREYQNSMQMSKYSLHQLTELAF